MKKQIPKTEDIVHWQKVNNATKEETCKHFGITERQLMQKLWYHNSQRKKKTKRALSTPQKFIDLHAPEPKHDNDHITMIICKPHQIKEIKRYL